MKLFKTVIFQPKHKLSFTYHLFGFFIINLFITCSVFAQDTKTTLEVDKRFHDFGKIKEDGGKVRAVFTIKNTGTNDLIIQNAEPSCGCTVGEWTKEPIAPGKTGTVTAVFDPKNLIGIIDKTIGVYTNAKFAKIVVLELRGEVVPRDRTMDDIFPYRVGNLMFDKEQLEFGDVPNDRKDSAFIVIYNDGQYPIKINSISPMPSGYKIRVEKNTIEPSQEVRLYVTIDGSQFSFLGLFNKTFKLFTDDPEYADKPLSVIGKIKYSFGKLSKKEMKMAPKVVVLENEKDFGLQASGSFVTTTFTIVNKGKSDLKILSINAQCYCTEASVDKNLLKPDESAILTVKFDLMGHVGTLQKPITIYTNDPKKPTIDVVVKATLY